MVRCMRKGHGALECPICLQLFNRPVTPVNSECRCTFCEGCFHNLVSFGGKCTKCARALPRNLHDYVVNVQVQAAIEAFQKEGGEDAAYAAMMSGLRSAKPRYQILHMHEFQLDPKPLATGAYGQVFKGMWTIHTLAVAVKKILRTSVMTHQQTMESFRKEIEILAMLDHPHVLKLYGAVVDDSNICIVTELVPGGSLFDLIHTKPPLRPEAVITIGSGVCKGMTYLHSMGVVHRDLKPGNLLMGAVQTPSGPQLVVKVADFGLARVQDTARTMTGGIGTSQYTAPEVLRSERYDNKADVYSFGIILWECIARKIPYADMNQMQIAVAVATQDHRPPPPGNCPAPFWQLMQTCWQTRPRDRPSFAEVLSQLEDMHFVFNLAASAQTSSLARASAPLPEGFAVPAPANGASLRAGATAAAAAMDATPAAMEASAADTPMQWPSQSRQGGGQVLRVPAMFATISEAIRCAGIDDRVLVSPGHYRETLEIRDKVLEIAGEGKMQELLLEGRQGAPAVVQEGGFVRLCNLLVKSSGSTGVEVNKGRLVVEDCNVSGAGVGLALFGASEATLRRSVVCRCRQCGIVVAGGSRAMIEFCSVFENGDKGVAVTEGSHVHLTRSMLSYNQGFGVAVDDGGEGSVEDNDLRNNAQGPLHVGALSVNKLVVGSNLLT